MEAKKSKTENSKVKNHTFKIVENGNCFELHKISKEGMQKIFVKANTNLKDFKEASKKHQK